MSNTAATPKWFTQFRGFTYDPKAGLKSNFNRLVTARQWGRKLKTKRWVECQGSLFDSLYGTDTSKLEIWQELCHEVHIQQPPSSITQCKKVYKPSLWSGRALTYGLTRFLGVVRCWSIWSTSLITVCLVLRSSDFATTMRSGSTRRTTAHFHFTKRSRTASSRFC
jgi:hypothetical protein